jgi:hypothetical protein
MTTGVAPQRADVANGGERLSVAAEIGVEEELLRPVLEGARARGVADALEMLGQAFLFLDGSGTILHASSRANDMIGGEIAIVRGHLVGSNPAAGQHIGDLIGAALVGPGGDCAPVALRAGEGRIIRLRARAFPAAPPATFQLVRAIVFLDPASDAA